MTRLFIALAFAASPATAQNSSFCQELWLSRNAVMDRAGQCFDTPLGQAVFDNSDCVEGDIRLTPLDAEITRMAREMEDWAECAVDTEAEQLVPRAEAFHAQLMELFTIPVREDTEHGCVGYFGPPIPLHTGISTSTTVLGAVLPGRSYSLSHLPLRGGWAYLEVTDGEGRLVAHGWTQDAPRTTGDVCEFSAG